MSTSISRQAALERGFGPISAPAAVARVSGQTGVLALFVATMFVSATLLFLVQPMFARMVLPLLGGSPAVWNTNVVFYQAVLLGGYVYAHAATRLLGVRRQAALHVALLLLPLLVLPIAVPGGWTPPTEANPIPWLLALLSVSVGLPFFVVSTSSPMLQKWFVGTGHRASADPYFLYAASNVGSMLALVAYPLLVEPHLRLSEQSWAWTTGYALLALLTVGCAVAVWRAPRAEGGGRKAEAVSSSPSALRPPPPALTAGRRLRWALLAFVPSSLMLSVTTYVSNNIVPIPLLWVVPLALYLLTFILVFAGRPILPHWLMVRALPFFVLPLVMVMLAQAAQPVWLLIGLHLATFFLVAMVCHGSMAADRPAPSHLTEFYLWMSLGGVLGGMFNALLAPLIFTSIVEYPLVLVLAYLVQRGSAAGGRGTAAGDGAAPAAGRRPPAAGPPPPATVLDLALPALLGLAVAGLVLVVQASGLEGGPVRTLVIFGLPLVVLFSFSRRPVRFGLGIGALFLANLLVVSELGTVLHAERSFYGIHRVVLHPNGGLHMLAHGGTLHGVQSLDPARRDEPLSYFSRSGPIGQVFAAFSGPRTRHNVAVVGLGAGSLACYREPGQQWTLYELDPIVVHIARDPRYFSFVADCTPDAPIILGDARLQLARTTDRYDLLILDAYSSDSPPLHLLTREALALYLERLSPDGIVAFNISNDFLNLKPVLAALAAEAGLVAFGQDDLLVSYAEADLGKRASQWAIIARDRAHLGPLADDPRWSPLTTPPGAPLWTDDFSSILAVLKR